MQQFNWKAKPKLPIWRIKITSEVSIVLPAVSPCTDIYQRAEDTETRISQKVKLILPNFGHLKKYHLIQDFFFLHPLGKER